MNLFKISDWVVHKLSIMHCTEKPAIVKQDLAQILRPSLARTTWPRNRFGPNYSPSTKLISWTPSLIYMTSILIKIKMILSEIYAKSYLYNCWFAAIDANRTEIFRLNDTRMYKTQMDRVRFLKRPLIVLNSQKTNFLLIQMNDQCPLHRTICNSQLETQIHWNPGTQLAQ